MQVNGRGIGEQQAGIECLSMCGENEHALIDSNAVWLLFLLQLSFMNEYMLSNLSLRHHVKLNFQTI
jgi:hypothetical protein